MERKKMLTDGKGMVSFSRRQPLHDGLELSNSQSENKLLKLEEEDVDEEKEDVDEHKIFFNSTNGENIKDQHASNIKQMQLENYSLRKRCKRLENIVSQLLETKEKPDDVDFHELEIIDVNNNNSGNSRKYSGSYNSDSNIIQRYVSSSPLKSLQYSKALLKTSTSLRPLTIRTDENSFPAESHSTVKYSSRKDDSLFASRFSAEVLAESSSKQRSLSRPPGNRQTTTSQHIRMARSAKEDSLLIEINKIKHNKSTESHLEGEEENEEITDHHSKNISTKDGADKNSNLSPEEMEQMNEMFRANYYAAKGGGRTNEVSNPKKSPTQHFSSYKYEKKNVLQSALPYPYSNFSGKYRISHSPPSPPSCRSPSNGLFSSFYKRYPEKHDTDYQDFRARDEKLQTQGVQHIEDVTYDYKISSHNSNRFQVPSSHYNKRDINGGYATHLFETFSTPSSSKLSTKIHSNNMRECYSIHYEEPHRYKPYSTPSNKNYNAFHQRPLADSDVSKYNSDFYTKLPPKLHIVESQNENGVTLTWNTTSNCDSSLVKQYQLFARELFGHKVGTMKRIGIVDALPLPMSCTIDKLKYNIKYKFAVCAIDVYGRYGKMSNFTGKFELKPKATSQQQQPMRTIQNSNNEELELGIVA